MAKHHEPSPSEGAAVLAAIQQAEREAADILEQARARHDQLIAKARAAAAQWEQQELAAARAEAQARLDAAHKAAKPAAARSKEAEALRAQGEKNLDKAVALISDSFDRFLDELTAEPAPATGAKKARR